MTNDLIPFEQYQIVKYDQEELKELIAVNLGDMNLGPQDLPSIKVPSGGGLTWEIATLSGEADTPKEVHGVILHTQIRRVYWDVPYEMSGGNEIPACSSEDGFTGIPNKEGNFGGDCLTCPMNKYGTKENAAHETTKGKACSERRFIFLLRSGSLLPMIFDVSPANLKPSKKYLIGLLNEGVKIYDVVTGISLKKSTNATGTVYSEPVFKVVATVPDNFKGQVKAYVDALSPILAKVAREMPVERNADDDIPY